MKIYVVYILTNKPRGILYVGFTNDLKRRMNEHRKATVEGFTEKYNLKNLVHIEQFEYVNNVIAREKQLKRWHRNWKMNLVEEQNPTWNDLFEKVFGLEN